MILENVGIGRYIMLKIYGSMLCPDCVDCRKELDAAGIDHQFCDFSEDLKWLKEFLKLRDGNAVYDEIRKAGAIGIPTILLPDGSITLSWKQFL